MFVKDVSFLKSVSVSSKEVFFDDRKEIVFVGRSNVWKSSLMNFIFSKKDLVKTSSRPGKTTTANQYFVNWKYYFTDLPGYGFAKLWKENREKLDALISWYLEERKPAIKKVVVLIDSKIWAQESDIDMIWYIKELWLPVLIILSKVDRLSKSEIQKSISYTEKMLFWQQIIPVSSTKKIGMKELEKVIWESLV